MTNYKAALVLCVVTVLGISACSRQQSDWEKTRTANTTEAYELFLKKYPSGEFTSQAQARVKALYEEHDWQKARDADTLDAYQGFLKQYPEGKWTEEARIRVENFNLAAAPSNAAAAASGNSTDTTPPAEPPASTEGSGAPAAVLPPKSSTHAVAGRTAVAGKSAVAGRTPVSAGTYGVQLGAFKSGADAANKRWASLEKEYPKLLKGLSPKIAPRKSAAGTLYRLQLADLSEKRASAICKTLKAHTQACVLLHPGRA